MQIKGRHLLVLVAMCGLLASGVGLVTNVAGLFLTPVAEEFGIQRGAASLMMTICNIAFAIGGLFAPRLMREGSFKMVLVGCTAVLAGGTAALAMCPGIVPMYALCVLRGVAAGIVGFVFVTSVLNQWFIASVGLATSIAMSCSGLAGAAFSPLVGAVIGGSGWRGGYLLLAALTVALNLPAILFLPSLDPLASGFKALGADDASAQKAQKASSSADGAGSARRVAPLLFALVFLFSVFVSATTALPQHFPGMAELYGQAAAGATMLSLCMVANSVGKIVFGAMVDRIGNRLSSLIYGVLVLVAIVMLLFLRGPMALVAAAVMYGLCYALGTVAITMFTRDTFGLENYSKTYPVIGLGGNMANAVFSSVVGFMYDFSGGYASSLAMMGILLVASMAIVVFVYAQKARA